uniref:Aminotransferase-like plant mobile domain-containing protein n=1 Tax=Brassica campestris TaxID=3711 RepID=A0A3P5YC04_BRACM|nr:unnamed protein product [Brassica rapa]
MDEAVFSVAILLSSGVRIALAPAVLAHFALFKLVQAWTYERFKELWPKHANPLLKGDPRLALWDDLKQKKTKSIANSKVESFEWRPYAKANLDEELISFARCIKASRLVGMDSMEYYFPNRVASQFGLLQDVPYRPVVIRNNLSKEAAWEEYNKSIDGLTLYIPSRSAVSCFTSMFCKWWRKGKRDSESLAPRNIIGDGDDGTSEHVPSGSKKPKSMKRVFKKDVTHMDLYQTQVPTESDEEDDSLTIAQEVVKRKREHLGDKRACEDGVGYASESLGKRNSSRLERDNNDSWIRQKLATKDETAARREETGNKAGKDTVLSSAKVVDIVVSRPETRQNCYDVVDENRSKAEKKKTIVAGGCKEAKCVIREDGETQRSNGKEDVEDSLKQTNLAIDELALSLEARMMKVEKTLAKIREWKTIERNQAKNGISA